MKSENRRRRIKKTLLILVLDQLANKLILALKVTRPVVKRLLFIIIKVGEGIDGSVDGAEHGLVERVLGQAAGGVSSCKVSVWAI